jgi:hypothetical protein
LLCPTHRLHQLVKATAATIASYLAKCVIASYLGEGMSDRDRLDRIETALLRVSDAVESAFGAIESGFAGATQIMNVLGDRILVLGDRMMVLEGQMTEALGPIRIIGEQLSSHTHPEGA